MEEVFAQTLGCLHKADNSSKFQVAVYTEAKTNKETTQVKNPLKKEQTQPIELQKEGIKQKKGKTTKSNGMRLLSNITNLGIAISKKK